MQTPAIRPLTRADRKTLTGMLERLVGDPKENWIAGLVSSAVTVLESSDGASKDPRERYVQIGIVVLQKLLGAFEADFCDWLRSLVAATPEEFDSMPIDVELNIIQQILDSKEGADFFMRALDLYKRTKGSVSQLQGRSAK